MTDPTTTLDQRYSSTGAQAASWEQTLDVLKGAQISWLTTIRANGRPHATPVVAAWGEGAMHFHTGDTEQKFINLRTNPNVLLTTGTSTWDSGLDVIIEGTAAQTTDHDTLTRLAPLWADKWDGRW